MKSHLTKAVALALLLGTAAEASSPGAAHGVVADLAVVKVPQRSDMIEYRITYRNTTYRLVHGVVGTLTIPVDRLSYTADNMPGLLVEASLDGQTFAPAPLLRLVVRDDGSLKMEPVPADEYRYLRWQLGALPAQASVTVKARMRINRLPEVLVTSRGGQ